MAHRIMVEECHLKDKAQIQVLEVQAVQVVQVRVAPVAQEWDPQVVNTEDLPLKACHPV
jgi:hypothetical protein